MARKSSLRRGLEDGREIAGTRLIELGRGIGDTLLELGYGAEWLSGGRLAVHQACPVDGCAGGPFSSLDTMRRHLDVVHRFGPRERSEALDTARLTCRRQVQELRRVKPSP